MMKKIKIVQISASWCGPCRLLTPVIESLKEDYKEDENIEIVKYDTDENPEVATSLNVRALPTIIFLVDEVEVERFIGLQSKQRIIDTIEKYKNS